MRVLLADKLAVLALERLRALGCEVESEPSLSADALGQALSQRDPDVLIVRSTRVSAEALAGAARLKLIIRAGAGYDTIAVDAASRGGIFVANCPGKNAVAVAELAWALILSCDRRVPDQVADLRRGTWNKKEYGVARGLKGATLGLLGLGTIGAEVAARGRAFGMDVLAWSRSLTEGRASELAVRRAPSALDVARQSDVVSVHVASTPDTRHLIGEAFIEAMKPGAYLINTSRGAVVDEAALARGVREKGIRAGLDVYAEEPSGGSGAFESDLAALEGVYGTHHVGASTSQAQEAIALEAVRIVEHFQESGEVHGCVNRARRSSATCLLTVRHKNRPGVLAGVFQVLSEAKINVEEMENVLYEGQEAACARMQLARAPTTEELDRIRGSSSELLGLDLSELSFG